MELFIVSAGVTVYMRYRQIDHVIDGIRKPHVDRTNIAALVIGMIACFGVSMVGNFQVSSILPHWITKVHHAIVALQQENLLYPHMVGALMAFVLGSVYGWLQVYFSFYLLNQCTSRPVSYLRLVLATIITLFLLGSILYKQRIIIVYTATTLNSVLSFHWSFILPTDRTNGKKQRWMPTDIAAFLLQNFRLLSTISEWIMALALAILFATFSSELRRTKVEKPRVFSVASHRKANEVV